MLFGSNPMKPKGLFGMFAPGQGQIPMPQQQNPALGQDQEQQLQSLMGANMGKKPGFFGEGGIGRLLAGSLGDALLQQSGGQPIYTPYMQQQQAMKQRQQMMQQQREGDWQDFQRQYDYGLQHPKPTQPHYWEANDGSLMTIGTDGQPTKVYADPTPKYNWIPDGMGGGRYEAIPGTGGAPQYPAKPVGKLTPITGDAGGNASGGFRGL